MAQNIDLLGAQYSDVPAVQLPKVGGGTALFSDTSDANAVASDIASGKTAYVNGEKITGTASGGGGTSVPEKDVTFFDYDGTIIYSYSASDFAQLSELPSNPTHSGMTAQGWNWTLSDAKTHVSKYTKLNIGQMCVTEDGKTRIYIDIPDNTPDAQMTFYVRFAQTVANGVTVDWGDGTAAETYSSTSVTNYPHTYSLSGKYIITLTVTSGKLTFSADSSYAIYGDISNTYNRHRIYKVEIGTNVSGLFSNYVFNNCYSLESINIPQQSGSSVGNYAFSGLRHTGFLSIPNGVTSLGSNAFSYSKITNISIPKGVTSVGASCFASCSEIRSVILPDGVTGSIGNSTFTACNKLSHLNVPEGVTSFGNYNLGSCELTTLVIPSTVTSIGTNFLSTATNLQHIYAKRTTPPTAGSNLCSGLKNFKIHVPANAGSAYKSASVWSNFASYIEEIPA